MNILSRTQPNYKAIVAAAIARGLVHEAPRRLSQRERRLELYSMGLTQKGEPRKTKHRPELRGLTGQQYRTALMRILRKEWKERV